MWSASARKRCSNSRNSPSARRRSDTSRKTNTTPVTRPAASRTGAPLLATGRSVPSRPIRMDGLARPTALPLRNTRGDRVLDRPAGPLVDRPVDLFERPADGLVVRPTGEEFGHRVQRRHPAALVRDDDGVADARQGRAEAFALFAEFGLGLPPPADLLGEVVHALGQGGDLAGSGVLRGHPQQDGLRTARRGPGAAPSHRKLSRVPRGPGSARRG